MKLFKLMMLAVLLTLTGMAAAADYAIDTKGAHASIQFRIKHLGYSWLTGRFNTFRGNFSYDEKNPAASRVEVVIETASIDSNHAERDKHLRDERFLDVDKYPTAAFFGTAFEERADGTALLSGTLELHGVSRPIQIEVEKIGHGPDPWGGYRMGFTGTTTIALKDFGIDTKFGPDSQHVELTLHVEGIRR